MGEGNRRNKQRRRSRDRAKAAAAAEAHVPDREPIGADAPEPSVAPSPPEIDGGRGVDAIEEDSKEIAKQDQKLIRMMLNASRREWPIDARVEDITMATILRHLKHTDGRVAMAAAGNVIKAKGQCIDIQNAIDRIKISKTAGGKPRRRVSIVRIFEPAPMAGVVIDAKPIDAVANVNN